MKSDLRKLFFLIRQPRTKKKRLKNAFFFFIFLLLNDTFERKKKKKTKRRSFFCRDNNRLHVWSDDESAEKRDWGALLWDLIVNNDDICFKHILPRLNRTDVKFLYGVNSETRKLIKRSSRARDLKKRFKVKEMSSISTLEVAWENKSLWPSWWTKHFLLRSC